MFASRYLPDTTSRYVEQKRRTDSVSLFLFSVQHVHLTDESKMVSGFLFSRSLSLALVSLLLYVAIPPSSLRSIQDLSSIQTPSYGPLPITPSAFTLPSTSFRYSLPPHLFFSHNRNHLQPVFSFLNKEVEAEPNTGFHKAFCRLSAIGSDYVCKPFQTTRFD